MSTDRVLDQWIRDQIALAERQDHEAVTPNNLSAQCNGATRRGRATRSAADTVRNDTGRADPLRNPDPDDALGVRPDRTGGARSSAVAWPISPPIATIRPRIQMEGIMPNDAAYSVTADELRQFIEQYEHLEAEKQDIAEQQKDIMSEAKGRGYDTKVIKKIIAIRKRIAMP